MTVHANFLTKFLEGLSSTARSADIKHVHNLYGFLVGSWDLDVKRYWAQDVSDRNIRGELHAGWVLEGRAIQDIWIMPRRTDRGPETDRQFNMYGSTLRAWDASIEAWRISWSNPAGNHFEHQIGRRVGPDIVQLGERPDGTATRWRFTEIVPDAFHWIGESRPVGDENWVLEGEFLARRAKPGADDGR